MLYAALWALAQRNKPAPPRSPSPKLVPETHQSFVLPSRLLWPCHHSPYSSALYFSPCFDMERALSTAILSACARAQLLLRPPLVGRCPLQSNHRATLSWRVRAALPAWDPSAPRTEQLPFPSTQRHVQRLRLARESLGSVQHLCTAGPLGAAVIQRCTPAAREQHGCGFAAPRRPPFCRRKSRICQPLPAGVLPTLQLSPCAPAA